MEVKDLFSHRKGRIDSDVVKLWKDEYKKQIFLESIVMCYRNNSDHVDQELLCKVRENEEVAEIAVDTIIGWLNSHVGRCFLREAFKVDIPVHDPCGND